MRLAVLGTGYVGLVAGAGFADFGNEVVCVDVDADKIARLGRGELPIYEPGLDHLVERNVREGRLSFTTDIELAVRGGRISAPGQVAAQGGMEVGPADAVFIAVGTPAGTDGAANLSYVLAAAETIGRALTRWAVIVTKSTVPVGTAEKVRAQVARVTDVPFAVTSNPEFLKEGDAIHDFMKPERVIIGTDDVRARELLRSLYAPFVRTSDRMLFMDARSAELTKYAANAMLATRISFMNDIANLCGHIGADVEAVRRGMGMDPRIGAKFLFPGIGYGGSCFPKDVKAVMVTAMEAGSPLEVLEAVHRVNERQKGILAERLAAHFSTTGRGLRGRTVALWGLSFKPGTDDIREAPALVILDRLLEQGATVRAYDPVAGSAVAARYAGRYFGDRMVLCESDYEAARGAEALVVCTEWHEFRRPDFARLKELMAEATVFDGRNIWDPAELRALGFKYHGIGRS